MPLVSRIRVALAAAGDSDADDAPQKPDENTATSESAGPQRDELTAAIARIRATSRWIVGGFAAVAAVVVGTAPLDKIGEVERGSSEFWIAVLALVAVIAGVVLVIGQAAAVDAPVGASPEQLKRAEASNAYNASWWAEAARQSAGQGDATRSLGRNPDASLPSSLVGDHDEMKKAAAWIDAADLVDVRDVQWWWWKRPPTRALRANKRQITFLSDQRDTARDQSLWGQLRVEGEEEPEERARLEKENAGREARFKRLDDELTYVVTLANYFQLNLRFSERKNRIMAGAVLAAVGIVAFQYAVSAETSKPDTESSTESRSRVRWALIWRAPLSQVRA
jgi:hypothetical protein